MFVIEKYHDQLLKNLSKFPCAQMAASKCQFMNAQVSKKSVLYKWWQQILKVVLGEQRKRNRKQ